MLSQEEFSALLQRYSVGQETAADQYLLDRWIAQPADSNQSDLTADELAQVQLAMWRRIEEATKEM